MRHDGGLCRHSGGANDEGDSGRVQRGCELGLVGLLFGTGGRRVMSRRVGLVNHLGAMKADVHPPIRIYHLIPKH